MTNLVTPPRATWQPISTCPKDGNAFLAGRWNRDKTYWWVFKVHWANGIIDGGWDGAREPIENPCTHWMPLPGPPPETSAVENLVESRDRLLVDLERLRAALKEIAIGRFRSLQGYREFARSALQEQSQDRRQITEPSGNAGLGTAVGDLSSLQPPE